jgi:hypothetical protein
MDEEMMEMMAMEEMMGGAPMGEAGVPPMEDGDEGGVTNVPVPNFAVAAVLELIAMLEEEMMGESAMPF